MCVPGISVMPNFSDLEINIEKYIPLVKICLQISSVVFF